MSTTSNMDIFTIKTTIFQAFTLLLNYETNYYIIGWCVFKCNWKVFLNPSFTQTALDHLYNHLAFMIWTLTKVVYPFMQILVRIDVICSEAHVGYLGSGCPTFGCLANLLTIQQSVFRQTFWSRLSILSTFWFLITKQRVNVLSNSHITRNNKPRL